MEHWPVELVIERYPQRSGLWETVNSIAIRGYELPRTLADYKAARLAAYDILEDHHGSRLRIIEIFDNGQKWLVWSDGKWLREMEPWNEE